MKCPCILKTDLNLHSPNLISIEYDHCHQANSDFVSAIKIKNVKEEKSKLTIDVSGQIFPEAILKYP